MKYLIDWKAECVFSQHPATSELSIPEIIVMFRFSFERIFLRVGFSFFHNMRNHRMNVVTAASAAFLCTLTAATACECMKNSLMTSALMKRNNILRRKTFFMVEQN